MRRFSWRRKVPTSSKAFVVLAAACGLSAFGLVRHETQRAEGLEREVGPRVGVVVAARDLDAGQEISEDDVDLVEMPQVFVPPRAIGALGDAIGMIAGASVPRGEPLSSARLAPAGGPLPFSVTPGHVAVTVEVPRLPLGLVPGDRVDVLATYGQGRSITSVMAADARVLQVPSLDGGAFGSSQTPWLTLDLEADVASRVVNATAYARLTVLVQAAEPVITASPSG
jgi:Flp pilus assembly protein CpaB